MLPSSFRTPPLTFHTFFIRAGNTSSQALAVVTPTMVHKLRRHAPLLAVVLLVLLLVPTALTQCDTDHPSCSAGDGGCPNTCSCDCAGYGCSCYYSGDPNQCTAALGELQIGGGTYGGDCTTTCNPCYLNCGCGLSTSCTPICSYCYCSCSNDNGFTRCPTSGRRLSSYDEAAAAPSIEPREEDRQLKSSGASSRKGNSKAQAKKSQRAYKRQCLAYVKTLDDLCDANCSRGIPPNGVTGTVSASICSALCAAQTAVRQVSCSR